MAAAAGTVVTLLPIMTASAAPTPTAHPALPPESWNFQRKKRAHHRHATAATIGSSQKNGLRMTTGSHDAKNAHAKAPARAASGASGKCRRHTEERRSA